MIIKQYGIELHRLNEKHIEMLRQWRNADSIRCFMEHRDLISPEQQKKWFDLLNPTGDFYFIIYSNNKALGMIQTNHVNWQGKSAYSGLFIYDEVFIGSPAPLLASLTMLDVFFYCFGLEACYAKVATTNKVAINYNISLGFRPVNHDPEKAFQAYILTKDSYEKHSATWRKLAEKIQPGKGTILFSTQSHQLLKPYIIPNENFEIKLDKPSY